MQSGLVDKKKNLWIIIEGNYMRICIIRHGETDWNNLGKIQGREDISLNDVGVAQIKETIKYLKNYKWEAIITSPLSRAKMSAQLIANEIGRIKIYEEADLMERNYGKASGMTLEETKKTFPDGKWPGVESKDELQSRTVGALLKYSTLYDDEDNIIIISHGSAINSILTYLNKNELNSEKITLRNACISLLEKVGARLEIIFYDKLANEL